MQPAAHSCSKAVQYQALHPHFAGKQVSATCSISMRRAPMHTYLSVSFNSRFRQLRAVSSSKRNSPQETFNSRICGRGELCEEASWVWQGKWLMKACQTCWWPREHQ